MAKRDRTGNRKTREQRKRFKVPELGYYLIVTDTEATEQCIREGKTKPSEMCPCTTVHELVREIKDKVNV